MQSGFSFTKQIKKSFLISAVLFTIIGFSFFSSNAHAKLQNDAMYATQIRDAVKDCPDPIKNHVEDLIANGYTFSAAGTYITAYDASGNPTEFAKCNTGADIEKLVVRIFVVIVMIVGTVFAFSVAKSALLIMTAFDDADKFQEGIKSLQTSIFAVIGVFAAHIIIVFIMTGILGIGANTAGKNEYNIVCQQRLVFSLTLDDPDLACP